MFEVKMQQQEVFIEQPSNQAPSDTTFVNQSNIPVGGMLLAYLSFIFIALVTVFWHPNLRKAVIDRIFTVKHNHQIPCNKCKFFKNNRYLQCAVHPTKVLNPEAIDCPDYLPKQRKISH
ncbi:hypothetical protein QUB80_00330 [Chlorogloeopsis sp. ULAP01]|uniref:hypothetical protein n=1 Tax=Chlorogloeopsis sp. ULAP01 TaxID=3056483 RepID=UPI0025AA7AA8|nr:hypothetical protein [Chlorogloeopsis sp. ULAP01]MDM9379154.1 hypothetical protein [Chlorogloeopsis sp. ULAP01]